MVRSKLPNVKTSIFSVMTDLANKHNALNLSQGFPDFNPPADLINLVAKKMRAGHNQYAPMQGLLSLREAISAKTEELHGQHYHPENEITVTAGATEAIFSAITAFVQEGDEVILFEPVYDSYAPAVRLNGGNPVYVSAKLPDFKIDWDEVNKVVNARTRMIIINSPHNPSGTLISSEGMERLVKLVAGTNILVLSDEVYEHIIFDGLQHESVAKYEALKERSIVVSSFGKLYNSTGWKLGYCLASENVMKEIRKIHQFNVYAANTPLQYAVADYLKNNKFYTELSSIYQEKRDEFLKLLEGTKFTFIPSQGTYFQMINYKEVSEEKDTEFADRLTTEYGLATIPASAFYHNGFDGKVLRLCFAKSSEVLKKAVDILHKVSDKA